jgi:hypothetical protein
MFTSVSHGGIQNLGARRLHFEGGPNGLQRVGICGARCLALLERATEDPVVNTVYSISAFGASAVAYQ